MKFSKKCVKTNQEWVDCMNVLGQMIQQKALDLTINDKFTYALNQTISIISSELELTWNKPNNKKRRELAMEDPETHEILKDAQGGMRYTKEAVEELNTFIEKQGKKNVEIGTYICTDTSNPRIDTLDMFTIEKLSFLFDDEFLNSKKEEFEKTSSRLEIAR